MLRKIHITTILLILSALFGTSIGIGSQSETEPQDYSVIYIYPFKITDISVGETYTISIVACGFIENLYGFDIVLKWDTAVVEYVSHDVRAPVESYADGVLHEPIFILKEAVDSTAGTFWISCSSMSPAYSYDGDGAFFTMTFNILSLTEEYPFMLESVVLSDDLGRPINIYKCEDFWTTNPKVDDQQAEDTPEGPRLQPKGKYQSFTRWKRWWLEVYWPTASARAREWCRDRGD